MSTADPEGPGVCAMILTLLSFLLVLVTMPFSLCVTIKVNVTKVDCYQCWLEACLLAFSHCFYLLYMHINY